MKKILLLIFLYALLLSALSYSAFGQALTLEQAVSLALTNNPEIKAMEHEVTKAREQSTIARSAYLPQVGLVATANHYFQRPVFFGFGEQTGGDQISYGRFGGSDQLNIGVVLDQALWNPQAFPAIKYATLQQEQNAIALRQKQVEIVSQVKQTYLQLLILNERIKLKQQNLERNTKVLQDSRVLLAQGKALRIDTLRAYTSVKNLEPDQHRLANELQTAKMRLAAFLGNESQQDVVPGDSLIIPIPKSRPTESEVFDIALQNNPRMQRFVLQESLDVQQSRQISAQRLPVLSLTGQYLLQSQTSNFSYGDISLPATSYVGLRLTMPLFTGFAITSRIQQAQLQQQQTSLLLQNERKLLRTEVHQLVSRYNETLERIAVAKGVNETAKLTFDIVQFRYKNGVASRLELTDSELALTQAQSNYLEAIYDYLTTRIQLFAAMGRTD
ncbi:MAG TPA: TolC family protein [Chryseosolibacter sp.]